MPEPVSGRPRIPARGDSEQWIKDTLARLEAQQEVLARAVAELTARAGELPARAGELPAAGRPAGRRRAAPRRRGDTFLRVVKAAVIAAVSLAALVAVLQPARITRARYSPQCGVSCSRPVARVDLDHDGDAR